MERKRKAGIIALIAIGVAIFGYSQYASASHISISMIESELIGTSELGSDYRIELEFENPTLLGLSAGPTSFSIESDGKKAGTGTLDPFALTPLSDSIVGGTYHITSEQQEEQSGTTPEDHAQSATIRISGSTEYDMLLFSILVPFEYYPTEEQARGFIHEG